MDCGTTASAASLPGYSPPQAFWEGLAERRDRHGFLVVFDEVVTGFGRTGSWFAYHQIPLVPDIVTFGKALGAGYAPLAGILCSEHVYEAVASGSREFEHGHTWDGAPLPCAVGLAVLETIEKEKLLTRSLEMGDYLAAGLHALQQRHEEIGDLRGIGLLRGIELVKDRETREPHHELGALTTQRCLDLGLSMNIRRRPERGSVWRIAPPLTVTRDDIDLAMTIFDQALTEMKAAIIAPRGSGTIAPELGAANRSPASIP